MEPAFPALPFHAILKEFSRLNIFSSDINTSSDEESEAASTPRRNLSFSQSLSQLILYDDEFIERVHGYKKHLYRILDLFGTFAFGFNEVAILTSVVIVYDESLAAGGPVVLIFGFIFTTIMTIIASISMAEICAAYPIAGSVYSWTALMAPPKYAPIVSYICGWLNLLGNATADAAFGTTFAGILSAAMVVFGADPLSTEAQVGTSIAIILLWSFMNIVRVDLVAKINSGAAILHFVSILITMIALPAFSKSLNSVDKVFFTYHNETGFTSDTYVVSTSFIVI